MNPIKVSTKLFSSGGGLSKALGDEKFTKMNPTDQVSQLWELFWKHVSWDKELSEQLMRVIRSATLFATETKILTEEEMLKLSHYELELMGRLSRKKVGLARFRLSLEKSYDDLPESRKQELLESGMDRERYIKQQIRDIYRAFSGVSNEIIDNLWERYNLSSDARLFLRAFNVEEAYTEDTLWDVCLTSGFTPDAFMEIGERFPSLGINTHKIQKEEIYGTDDTWRLTGNYLNPAENVSEDLAVSNAKTSNFINPNWFLYDIDADTAIKLWWPEKTKYIFWKYFRTGIGSMWMARDLQMPEFYNFSRFRIKLDEDADGNRKKLIEMDQHISEWEIPDDFTQSEFAELVKWLRWVISDFRSSGEPKNFDHPIQTRLWAKKFSGYFSGSKWYENTHIIDIQPIDKNGKRTLRFATELGQDVTLFVTIQTSYFLKNKKLLPTHLVWREIYAMYNRLSLEWVERFDPSTMKEQYDTLVKKVVWPLSAEHKEKKGGVWKPHNVLLYGVYGTGKSQLLTHLIAERKYTLPNDEEIHLDANVINIWIMEFADLLVKSASSFRKRLSDIHENTGNPIILIIEDIDTIVKEQWLDSDPVSQAMTTLFEWVWSLPVTVIASTNNPEILPQRHLRPNRLDTLLSFEYPMKKSQLKPILQTHWKGKWLSDMIWHILPLSQIGDSIIDRVSHFTPSHISALCLGIYEALEFVNIEELWLDWIKTIIDREINNCLVPVSDMQARENSMQKWRSGLGSSGNSIGFMK